MSNHVTKMSRKQRKQHAAQGAPTIIEPQTSDIPYDEFVFKHDVPAYLRINPEYLSDATARRQADHWQQVARAAGEVIEYCGKPAILDARGLLWISGVPYVASRMAIHQIAQLVK